MKPLNAVIGDTAINTLSDMAGSVTNLFTGNKLAQHQYDKDVEMWNRANAYNDPKMQMERLKNAGLNPNMVYGNGSVVGNTSTSTPQYKAPQVDFKTQTPNMLDKYRAREQEQSYVRTQEFQQQLIEANMDKTNAEMLRILDDLNYTRPQARENTQIDIDTKKFDLGQKNALSPYIQDRARLENTELQKRINLVAQELVNKQAERVNLGQDYDIKQNIKKGQNEENWDKKEGLDTGGVLGSGLSFKTIVKQGRNAINGLFPGKNNKNNNW